LIEASQVGVRVGSLRILPPVSFRVAAGEILVVTGPSGSGKSTLVRCLAGLTQPSEGTVRIDGTALSQASARERARFRRAHLGIVFQEPELLLELSAIENVALPMLFSGRDRSSTDSSARAALAEVGCDHLADARPSTLSGGEAIRVATARALAVPGRVVLADEPTASLDRANALAVGELLVNHARDHKAATVIATHDPEIVAMGDVVLDLRAVGM
jgi:ABC-type lipoprotein export system ATPase subunit